MIFYKKLGLSQSIFYGISHSPFIVLIWAIFGLLIGLMEEIRIGVDEQKGFVWIVIGYVFSVYNFMERFLAGIIVFFCALAVCNIYLIKRPRNDKGR